MGEKIYLSPLNPEDYELFGERMNNPETQKNAGGITETRSIPRLKEWLEEMSKDTKQIYFAIVKKESNECVGFIFLRDLNLDPPHRTAWLGINIGKSEERWKWYGKEAMKCILNYGFNTLNLNNIMLTVYEFNENARKCYEKCWFTIIGTRRQAYFCDGKYHDTIYMDITKDDFNQS